MHTLLKTMNLYDADLWGLMVQVYIRSNNVKLADQLVEEMKPHGSVSASSLLSLARLTTRSDPIRISTLNYISNREDIEITASYAAFGASSMMHDHQPVEAIKFYHIRTHSLSPDSLRSSAAP
jgi:hypothetical protein